GLNSPLAQDANDIRIIAAIEAKENQFVGKIVFDIKILDDILAAINDADCVVEFTNHNATMDNLRKVKEYKK
ncbi:unnamed protein product, partial [marine sediment metagenome]